MNIAFRTRLIRSLAALVSGLVLMASSALAQSKDEYGQITQTVARISYIDGSVSYARGDDPDDWQAADQNVPMTIGDRVYTGNRSRAELEVHGGDVIRLGAQTDLAALNLTDDTKQFSVNAGVASFQVRRLEDNEVFEIDTPNAAITAEQPGNYRVDIDENGNTRVMVRSGQVTVAAGGGQVPLQAGDEMNVEGIEAPRYDVVSLRGSDNWDHWVEQRGSRLAQARSLHYVSSDVVGVDDLDEYGRWQQIPDYGRVWSPNTVAADWVPYRVGHWIWQDPWGWTWVSSEPWGWAPYHYGRWVVSSSRWYWVPVAPAVRVAAYSPALVAFVGGGPGGSASAAVGGGGFVGWFPLGPRDPFAPWWTRSAAVNVNVANVTYVNRTYVTVVNQNTFVSGGVVTGALVRDRTVLRQVASAPIVKGPLPVVPTSASLRVAVRPNLPAAPRPPAQILSRSVMARVAPPSAPPTFQAKLAVIQQNHGAPVSVIQSEKISVASRDRAQAITQVRAVTAESGKVTLAPKSESAGTAAHRAEPIAAGSARGRRIATEQQPTGVGVGTPGNAAARGSTSRETSPIQQQNIPSVEKGNAAAVDNATVESHVSQPTPQPADRGRDVRSTQQWRQRRVTPEGSPQTQQAQPEQAPARENRRAEEGPTPPPQHSVDGATASSQGQPARPTPQKAQAKKKDKGKEKPKKQEEKKDDRERKPE